MTAVTIAAAAGEQEIVNRRASIRAGESSLRNDIVKNALWGVEHEPTIHYKESRPIEGIGDPLKLPLTTDCSGFATLCYSWAGAPDPNGYGYNGMGFTGSMLNHLDHISREDSRPGDLVVFGSGKGVHVVILVNSDADPDIVSHGEESGPHRMKLSVEETWQRNHGHGMMTFLRMGAPDLIHGGGRIPRPSQVTLPHDLGTATNAATGGGHSSLV